MNLGGISIRDLEYIVAVARHEHFGRAAAACGVSQPNLSNQIRKLEEYLGVAVFERGARQVIVTARGAELVAQARVVLREVGKLGDIAEAAKPPLSGHFRLGIISTVSSYLMPYVLRPLREKFPSLKLCLHEGLTGPLLESLEHGELDAVLASLPVRGGDIHSTHLFDEPLVLALPRGHALTSEPRVTIADLRVDDMILLADDHWVRDQALALGPPRERESYAQPVLHATSMETLRHMIASGVGYSLIPELAAGSAPALDDLVIYRPFDGVPPSRPIALHCRMSYARSDAISRLAALLRDSVPAAAPVAKSA